MCVSLQTIVPWLLGLGTATIAGMMLAVRADKAALTALFAIAFVAAACAAFVRANGPSWRGAALPRGEDASRLAARRNARLAALTYAWASLAMQAVYTTPITGLRWHHGWQYALAFALLAVCAFAYARTLGRAPGLPLAARLHALATPLAAAQGLVAAGGLTYLAASGKLLLYRADWAANIIFVAAALAIMVLTAISLRTHLALMRRAD